MDDPIILFFLMGVVAGALRSQLRLPPAVYDLLTIMLLVTIGLKGGVELAKQSLSDLLPQIAAVTAMGFALPFIAYPLLRWLGKFSRENAASIAAHYGSVSVGTFAVAISFLESQKVFYEEHMTLFVVILEVPAIIVGLFLAKGVKLGPQMKQIVHEVFLGKSIVLLMGGLVIGWIVGPSGVEGIKPFFFDLFKGVLALFLLEMGLVVANQLGALRKFGLKLLAFGLVIPPVFAMIGIMVASLIGLSVGGATILGVLAASASYIAVPAAIRISVPEANPTLSLTASLGITFPLNVVFGIPLYLSWAQNYYGAY